MILKLTVGDFIEENCYIFFSERVSSDNLHHGFVIDPGGNADEILRVIEEKKIFVEKILITHGHYDHIAAIREVQSRFNARIVMSRNGKRYASSASWNLSNFFQDPIKFDDLPIDYLEDHSKIILDDDHEFELLETPGHTLDSAIFYNAKEHFAFAGDTIFQGSHGRFDLPGGNYETLINSVRNVVMKLPDETVLLPGHGESTTIEAEKSLYIEDISKANPKVSNRTGKYISE